jgi:type II secretory pathway predicted ATPase ExeA
MIDAQERLKEVDPLIAMGQYFVIHAARQSGKTTFLKDLADRLNQGGKYYALYCSLETLQGIADEKVGIPQIVHNMASALQLYKLPHAEDFATNVDFSSFSTVLKDEIKNYCALLDKPLVILFDEADCLSNGTLITFLRQLRNGYIDRKTAAFVHSLALVGMRNIRDYKGNIRPDNKTLGSASPFNIVTETLTLKNFTKQEIAELYAQHTSEQGQVFEPQALELVWQQTQGQPWLVNAIVREVIVKLLNFEFSKPVTAELCEQAIENIILRRDVHIDSLLERLKEERVQRVIEPMLLGESGIERLSDDFQYVMDLGLIKEDNGKIVPANPIYADVIIRSLNFDLQYKIKNDTPDVTIPRYIKDGKVDMKFLMTEFQKFWRKNSGIWGEMIKYREAAPHLVLMAFLQRVVNGGGQILRELAIDSGRTDLGIVYDGITYPIEIKLWKGEEYYKDGLSQTAKYIDGLGCREGVLAIVNRSNTLSWDEKIYQKTETIDGKNIFVYGM